MTAFERNVLENGRPEILANAKELELDYPLLHWAYEYPVANGGGRDLSNVYRTLHAALGRCDAEFAVALNIRALRGLRARLGDDDIGRYIVVDGTDIVAPREQRSADPFTPEEEPFLRNGLASAAFGYHGTETYTRKRWRGYTLIVLIDVKTSLPIAWLLIPANRPEHEYLDELLQLVYRYWEDWTPEVLIGDAHFDTEPVCQMLEERYGIHPVFPRNGTVGAQYPWHASEGTPTCSAHGDMKLIQSEGLSILQSACSSVWRRASPKAAFRWRCVDANCPTRARTMFKDNPRLYTFYPRRGEHRARIARREALMLRRNVGEAGFASLKGKGIGLRSQDIPRWVKTDIWVKTDMEMCWLCGGTLLGMTLRRLTHEFDLYAPAHAEAERHGFLAPTDPDRHSLRP
jgi:hypothetical protein